MSFTVRYTEQAEADLYRNADWWALNHSLEQALEWESTIRRQIQSLTDMPERHALAPENENFTFDIREKPIGLGGRSSYRAIYTIVASDVRVLAIRRASQGAFTPNET